MFDTLNENEKKNEGPAERKARMLRYAITAAVSLSAFGALYLFVLFFE